MKPIKKSFLVLLLSSFTLIDSPVRIVNLEQLESATHKNNDTLYVVNFWATWCMPCVKELPYFQESAKKYAGQKVKIIFPSLNSTKEMATVQKFTNAKKIVQDVFIFDGGSPNVWLDKIDKTWDGAIPATVMYKNNKKVFFREGDFTQTELDSIINLKNEMK